MHPRFAQANDLSREVIGAAIEVHRLKGPGLLESLYEKFLARELELRGISCESQVAARVEYKGAYFEENLRLDLLVERCLLVELKCVQEVHPVHKAQVLSYLRLLNLPLGLLINFHQVRLTDGIHRLVLQNASA